MIDIYIYSYIYYDLEKVCGLILPNPPNSTDNSTFSSTNALTVTVCWEGLVPWRKCHSQFISWWIYIYIYSVSSISKKIIYWKHLYIHHLKKSVDFFLTTLLQQIGQFRTNPRAFPRQLVHNDSGSIPSPLHLGQTWRWRFQWQSSSCRITNMAVIIIS